MAEAANPANKPVNSGVLEFATVLEQEFRAIHGHAGNLPPELAGMTSDQLRHEMWKKETSALCLSGGGIRSASFCLGAAQALAREGYLRNFHYLSTVSGGGYIGSLLAAWGYRAGPDYEEVERGLDGKLDKAAEGKPGDFDPLAHLRNYTSYLAPRYGLLSTDTWTLFSTYLRNLALNWLMLIPLCCVVLLAPHLLLALMGDIVRLPSSRTALLIADSLHLAGVLTSMLAVVLWRSASSLYGRTPHGNAYTSGIMVSAVLACALLSSSAFIIQARGFDHVWTAPLRPLAQLAADSLAWIVALPPQDPLGLLAGAEQYLRGRAASAKYLRLPLAYALLGALAWLFFFLTSLLRQATDKSRPYLAPRSWPHLLVSFVVTGLVTGLALHAWSEMFARTADHAAAARHYWTFGPPAVGLVFGLAEALLIGLVSKQTDDFDREWWARMAAMVLFWLLLWIVVCAVSLLVPAAIRAVELPAALQKLSAAFSAVVALVGAVVARLAFTRPGAAAGPGDVAGKPKKRGDLMLSAVGFAFLVLFLCSLAYALDAGLDWSSGLVPAAEAEYAAPRGPFSYHYGWSDVLLALGVVLAILAIVPSYVHINRFSLHGMYRERLIRAFLGGSRRQRVPPADLDNEWGEQHQYAGRVADGFTGFDRHDNPILWWLSPDRRPPLQPREDLAEAAAKPPPFQIVNCALNLAAGERLAWQERKASSFTFTALHAGSRETRYRSSKYYSGDVGGVTLGTALTISGAAVSPNAGQHSSPVLTAVLTLFNARLGAWLGNPGYDDTSRRSGPRYALLPLTRELLGRTTANSPWIHLSDGGHFDNLGIYEAVRRGCRYVVAIDASADPERSYADLGNAIRKIRLDLEARVEIAGEWWIGDVGLGAMGRYCALFSIQYLSLPGRPRGSLLYVKPAVYPHAGSRLPTDVLQYSRQSAAFPHESTVNQFFTESQFESYRALGEHELATLMQGCRVRGEIGELFEAARRYIDAQPKPEAGHAPQPAPGSLDGTQGQGDSQMLDRARR